MTLHASKAYKAIGVKSENGKPLYLKKPGSKFVLFEELTLAEYDPTDKLSYLFTPTQFITVSQDNKTRFTQITEEDLK